MDHGYVPVVLVQVRTLFVEVGPTAVKGGFFFTVCGCCCCCCCPVPSAQMWDAKRVETVYGGTCSCSPWLHQVRTLRTHRK